MSATFKIKLKTADLCLSMVNEIRTKMKGSQIYHAHTSVALVILEIFCMK